MGEILGLLTLFVPLFAIVWLANLAEAGRQREQPSRGPAIMAYVLLIALYALGIFVGVMMHVAALVLQLQPGTLDGALPVDMTAASLPLLAIGFWAPSLGGILLLLPPARRLVARFTKLDADNPVHAIALSLSMLVLINLLVTLGIGLDNLADLMAASDGSGAASIPVLWVQQVSTALLALLGVGWLTRRSLAGALARLAIVPPTRKEWLVGALAGLLMVPVVMLLEFLGASVGIGASPDVERLTEQLLGALVASPLGILTIGLSAALGEETLFRGALAPRFGMIFSSLLFALVHSNYGITFSSAVVLLLGLMLAYLRTRYNTSTAMVTHAVYNISLGVLAYLSASILDF